MAHATLQLDDELAALLAQDQQSVPDAAREMIVLELYRRGTVSSGKAAQLLGMGRYDFVRKASALGIPFFDMPAEEWDNEMKQISRQNRS